jgi:tRNA(fMet)-specific endonuclease VapC
VTLSRYLLDTNILSELVRQPQGIIAECIASAGESNVCTSIVVAAELKYGARRRNSRRLTRNVEAILAAIEVLPLEEPTDRAYAVLRTTLEERGIVIGPNDMLIAAHALTIDHTVVTANHRELSRVPGLRVENWLQ